MRRAGAGHGVRRSRLLLGRNCRLSWRLALSRALAHAELLRRTAPTAPMYHPALPGPPAWGCFTAPPFQAEVAAEALLGMLSTNIFWGASPRCGLCLLAVRANDSCCCWSLSCLWRSTYHSFRRAVGLWDLLDNTIFPNDTNGQMCFLVCATSRH